MFKIQLLGDKLAIALSSLCVVHCLFLPLLIVLVPSLATIFGVDHENFHAWILYLVVPLGLFALFLGYRRHKNSLVLSIGLIALIFLLLTSLLGHKVLGETLEIILTAITASLLAYAHFRNYKTSKNHQCNKTLAKNHH